MDRTGPRSAAAVMTLSALLFGVMALLAKAAAQRLPGEQIAFVRFVVGIAVCATAATRLRLRVNNRRGLFWRGAFGGAAVACYFAAIGHLSIGMATLLNYTSPVFTALFAWLFLDEHIGLATLGALAITTCGVAMVIAGNAPPGMTAFGTWQIVGVTAAVLSGAAVATIREVRKTDGSWEIFGAFCIAGALITAGPAAHDWVAPTLREWILIVAVGLTSVLAQLLMTWSLRDLSGAAAGILFQLTPVSVLLFGRLVFNERPGSLALTGAAVTLGGVGWGAWLASVHRPRTRSAAPAPD